MVKSTFAKYAERASILVVALIVVAWVFLTFFADDSQEPDAIGQGQEEQTGENGESDSGDEATSDQSGGLTGVPPGDGDAATGGNDSADTSDGTGDGVSGGGGTDGGTAGDSDGSESEGVRPGQEAETEPAGGGVSAEPDQSASSESEDDGTDGGDSAEDLDGSESDVVGDVQTGPEVGTESVGNGTDGDAPLDDDETAGDSNGSESDDIGAAQPDVGTETESALGSGGGAEPDQSASSGSEDGGTDGGDSAGDLDGSESDVVGDAQTDPEVGTESAGNGTDGDAPKENGASAADLDGPKADAADGEQPVVIAEPSDGADIPAQEESVILPTFDVVRVDPFKFATIAGRGMPNWAIDVLINSELKESGKIGGDGQFAFVFQLDTEGGPSEIALLSRDEDGTIYRSPETVVIIAPESVASSESEEIRLSSVDQLLPAVLIATPESVKLKQPPIPDQPSGNPGENLLIDSISYDLDGEVVLAGRGGAKGYIRIYLDNLLVATERITDFGTWEISLSDADAGRYILKIEELDQYRNVVASIVTPFQKEFQGDALERMKEAGQVSGKKGDFDLDGGRIADIVTVQPGYTLWGISRRSFGQGRFFVRIYHTNIDQIDDPDLIFPGQLLVVPNFETAPPRRPNSD